MKTPTPQHCILHMVVSKNCVSWDVTGCLYVLFCLISIGKFNLITENSYSVDTQQIPFSLVRGAHSIILKFITTVKQT